MPDDSAIGFSFTQRRSASNKTPRHINRNLVFNFVRTHQPLSRADVARMSGLQRSTVSLIVEELIRDRWVTEGSIGRLPRGRRPTFLQLNDDRAVIALDIHTAQTTIAVANLAGRIVAQTVVALPEDPKAVIAKLAAAVKKLMADNRERSFDGIGICFPGRPDPERKHEVFTPRLDWSVSRLKDRLERATGLRVEMDNVANACVLSEVWFGETDGIQDMVVVNVSEGLATGIFVNGRLLRGQAGMAGEFGHVQIESDGPICECGSTGCWESFASNKAGLRYYQEASGKTAPAFETLIRLAGSGDQCAVAALRKMGTALGRGLRMIAAALAPSEIIVVGEITNAWYLVGASVEAAMTRNSTLPLPHLRPAPEGNTARLRSAVALVMNEGLL